MNVQDGLTESIREMLKSVEGLKALLLDDETSGIIGLTSSQSEINLDDVFLTERLNSRGGDEASQRHLKAIVFVRPTAENNLLLRKELSSPMFAEYYIFFSNAVRRTLLEDLAEADVYAKVIEVKEIFADVFPLSSHLFSLNVSPCYDASKGLTHNPHFERTVEGLFSVLLTLQCRPIVRFDASSTLCRNLAERLSVRIDQERSLFEFRQTAEYVPVLLILDRREDPVTPLLNQWTYEAMTHELLGMRNNRVSLRGSPGVRSDGMEVVLDARTDDFYRRNMYLNFGELGDNVKHFVDAFQVKHRVHDKLETIDDMMRFVEHYPEFRSSSNNVTKHVSLLSELSRLVDKKHLLQVSQLEQDLACRESEAEHREQVTKMLKSPRVTREDKLRLVLLYSLRYENMAERTIGKFMHSLYEAGLGSDQVALVRALIRYAGASMRSGDVFNNRSFLAKARNTVRRGFGGVANVYTQHEPLLAATLDDALRGRLRTAEYPVVVGSVPVVCKEMIVFIAGGATLEEARCVAEINSVISKPDATSDNSFISSARAAAKANGARIVLGGSTIHNTMSFLGEVSRLSSIS